MTALLLIGLYVTTDAATLTGSTAVGDINLEVSDNAPPPPAVIKIPGAATMSTVLKLYDKNGMWIASIIVIYDGYISLTEMLYWIRYDWGIGPF